MGDRAVVVFDDYKPEAVGLYVHWMGSDVPDLVDRLRELMLPSAAGVPAWRARHGDPQYALARLAYVACARNPEDNSGVGIGRCRDLDCDNIDNGVYVVESRGYTITERYHVCEHSRPEGPGWSQVEVDDGHARETWKLEAVEAEAEEVPCTTS